MVQHGPAWSSTTRSGLAALRVALFFLSACLFSNYSLHNSSNSSNSSIIFSPQQITQPEAASEKIISLGFTLSSLLRHKYRGELWKTITCRVGRNHPRRTSSFRVSAIIDLSRFSLSSSDFLKTFCLPCTCIPLLFQFHFYPAAYSINPFQTTLQMFTNDAI